MKFHTLFHSRKWEAAFKKKYDDTLSVVSHPPVKIANSYRYFAETVLKFSLLLQAEMECCRRIVELGCTLLYCTYHYHCLQRLNRSATTSCNALCSTVPTTTTVYSRLNRSATTSCNQLYSSVQLYLMLCVDISTTFYGPFSTCVAPTFLTHNFCYSNHSLLLQQISLQSYSSNNKENP